MARTAGIIAPIVTFAAIWSVISIVLRRRTWVDWVTSLFSLVNLPVAASLFSVVVLFIVGGALRRRLRIVWLALLVYQSVALVLTILFVIALITRRDIDVGRDYDAYSRAYLWINIGVNIAIIALLLWIRPAFAARLRRRSVGKALGVLALGIAISTALSIALTYAFPGSLRPGYQKFVWAVRIVVGLEPGTDEPQFISHHGHHWITSLVGLLSALAVLAALAVFVNSGPPAALMSPQDELDTRRLLLTHGQRDSLGYFATRRDKSIAFNSRRTCAVTYRVIASVSLASGDPIGPSADWDEAIAAWLARARQRGWFPAVLSASEQGAQAYARAGLKAMPLGDEAIVDVDNFTLAGPTMEPVRRAVGRVERAGYTLRIVRHSELLPADFAAIESAAEQWRGDEPERGFSMALSRIGDGADGSCVAVLAYDPSGRLRAVQSYVPWGNSGLSLDLMRRDPASENGITEFLIAGLMLGCADIGVRRASLNFAMFRGIFSAADRVGAGPLVRLANAILGSASRFWQLETLYRSNARYYPNWVPRFICYDSGLSLSRVALAAGTAEGFLPTFSRLPERSFTPESTTMGSGVSFYDAVQQQREDWQVQALKPRRLSEQERVRRSKLELLSRAGMSPYPVSVPRTSTIADIRAQYPDLCADTYTHDAFSICGRVTAIRSFGRLTIAVLAEESKRIQVLLATDVIGMNKLRLWNRAVDLGDIVSVTGRVMTSRTGELSIEADDWTMSSKCLRPMPDAHAGFSDPESRARQRYLDLIVNEEAMDLALKRTHAVRAMRNFFDELDFREVETPMLQQIHGGANARPFSTHINAYDMPLYLRIAPELYLKRLCIGGMPRIFELNRNFRNEGVDATHNPEFTSLEAYQAYGDYLSMRDLTRQLILTVATAIHGRPIAIRPGPDGRPTEIDLSVPWRTITVHAAVSEAIGEQVSSKTPIDVIRAICTRFGVAAPPRLTAGELFVELYDELVEGQTQFPVFYTDFPVETSPLTRVHRNDPALSERWDLVAFGAEIGTAYSELIDPIDQRRRFTEQSLKAAAGDPEAMQIDEAFLAALEYGMPPTGGLGIGVDRLIMLLTGTDIRSILTFPFVRPTSS